MDNSHTHTVCVQVFLRFPRVGQVKTRLSKDVGDLSAYEFYRYSAMLAIEECLKLSKEGIKIVLSFSSEFDIPEAINWVESSLGKGTVDNRNVFVRWQLPNCDIGERMIDAIDEELTLGAQKAIIVGSDIPDISADVLRQAIGLLSNHDMVLGPAVDGGYYAIGATRVHRHLFHGVAWSTDKVYEKTERNAEKLGLKVTEKQSLPTLRDIDTLHDLNSWYGESAMMEGRGERYAQLRSLVGEILLATTTPKPTDADPAT